MPGNVGELAALAAAGAIAFKAFTDFYTLAYQPIDDERLCRV